MRRDPALRYSLLATAVVAIGWLPWLPFFLRQKSQVEASYWIAPLSVGRVLSTFYQLFVQPLDSAFPVRPVLLVAALCVAGLLLVLVKPKAGEIYVFMAAVIPFALSLAVSLRVTNVFYYRYLAFAQLFFLVVPAILIHRLPVWTRSMLTCLLLAFCVWTDLRFWRHLDVDHHPGARAAAAFIDKHRGPGEPVVAHPVVFLPVLYYSTHRDSMYIYAEPGGVAHYSGAAVLTPAEVMNDDDLRATQARRVWAVNGQTGWGDSVVPLAKNWNATSMKVFHDVFSARVVVVTYEAKESLPERLGDGRKPTDAPTRKQTLE